MKFQELLKIIANKYKGEGQDYTHFWGETGNHNSGGIFEKTETYEIYSPELKKEAHGLMLINKDVSGGEGLLLFSRVGREINGKWYEYERGDGDQPDKFSIKVLCPEELERRKKELEEVRNKAEKTKEEIKKSKEKFEEQRKEWEKSFENSKKKCDKCGKELDSNTAKEISIGQIGNNLKRVYFCPESDCSADFFKEKYRNEKEKREKCDMCGSGPTTTGDHYYWEYLIVDGKTYCGGCADKLPKKSESELEQIRLNALKNKRIEQERTKLRDLKSKLQNSSNSAEKERLQTEIDEIKNHLKELENKDKSKNNSNQSNQGYGKLFLVGAVIFILVVILVSILVARVRKRKLKRSY